MAAFTLIELLVSLAVFGMLSLLAYQALGNSLSNADLLGQRMDRLQGIQRAMGLLTYDLLQTAPRAVRSDLGETRQPALFSSLSGEFAIELTRGGWGNPAGLPRGTLQRVAYRIEDGRLVRYHWNALDRAFGSEAVITPLLEDVVSLVFRYYVGNDEWSEVWPPPEQRDAVDNRARPRAVEVVLTLADEGELSRIVEVAP